MEIVTTTHIYDARDYTVRRISEARDVVVSRVNNTYRDLKSLSDSIATNLASRIIEAKENVDTKLNTISNALQQISRKVSALIESHNVLQTREVDTLEPNSRVFFSNINAALDATRDILSYVPPNRYNVPQTTLPLEELFGQLHALHQNLLEWLTHISKDVDHILSRTTTSTSTPGIPSDLMKVIDNIQISVDDVKSLQATTQEMLTAHNADGTERLNAIENHLGNLQSMLNGLLTKPSPTISDNTLPTTSDGTPSNKPVVDEDEPLRSQIEPYQAKHPTKRCRTYGNIIYNGVNSHIPMDLLGRPVSTALKLYIDPVSTNSGTTVNYKLFDDNSLLLAETVQTPHIMTQPLSDSLALLHSKCSEFLYKIKGYGLC
ncbi:TGB3 [Garlic virus J]|nr:TGB3 [Garlic virus J]